MQEHLLGIAVCSLIMLKVNPQSLTNVEILGQGNLNLVSEKSGKSQGILRSVICGNPDSDCSPFLMEDTLLHGDLGLLQGFRFFFKIGEWK